MVVGSAAATLPALCQSRCVGGDVEGRGNLSSSECIWNKCIQSFLSRPFKGNSIKNNKNVDFHIFTLGNDGSGSEKLFLRRERVSNFVKAEESPLRCF